MAERYFAINGGERGRSWDDKWATLCRQRLNRFKDYDAKLKLAGMDRSACQSTIHLQERGKSTFNPKLNAL